jgi:ribonuclease HI
LKRKASATCSASPSPLHRSPSFSGRPSVFQNPDLELIAPRKLGRTRSETFASKLIFDPSVLQPRTPEAVSPTSKLGIKASTPHSPSSPSSSVTTPPAVQAILLPLPPIMAARYAPLVLVAPLHAMPQDYQTRLPQFDATGPLNAQQHVDKMNDYLDLQEVDEVDVQMRLFAQSLTGEVKKWFKALPAASIADLAAFQRSFLDRWGVKKNPLQILSEYENIKRNQGEAVQDYCTRFNNLYNAIPADIKPPPGLALIKFPDGFDADMSYQLRERDAATLEDMQKCAISVEANLLAKRARQRNERRVTIREEPSTSIAESKLDSLSRNVEFMMEKLSLSDRNPPRDNAPVPQIRNPNFRRNPPQIRQRDPRDQRDQRDLRDQREQRGPDPPIKPPLQENYADDGEEVIEELEDTHINLMGIHDNEAIFLTQEEQELFLLNQTKVSRETEGAGQPTWEDDILEVHRQYNLRSKKAEGNSPRKTTEAQKTAATQKTPEKTTAGKSSEKGKAEAPVKKNVTILKRPAQPEISPVNLPSTSDRREMDQPESTTQARTLAPFSLEAELAKIKIPVPLTELISRGGYRSQVLKALAIEPDIGTQALAVGSVTHSDTVNLTDDRPELLFGPAVDGRDDTGDVAPFYISLNIHDLILHNAMLDSGASHNLMPKAVMEKLGLEVTRPYKDLHSFDSSKVKCIGLIKDLCITLVQIPSKSMVMDVVVADIPPKYGMLLSRSWGAKLKGTLQLDMSYATVPVFGQQRRLYRETLMKYMVSSQEKPHNYPLYSAHSDLDSFILYNDSHTEEQGTQLTEDVTSQDESPESGEATKIENEIVEDFPAEFWSMDFDGAVSKEGAGAGVWLHNHQKRYSENHSYKLNFHCTNNVAEYEALMLGLKLLKKVGAKQIMVRGDSELIIKQIKGEYAAKHPRLRAYRNAALDALKCFNEVDLQVMPRGQNILADGLATSAASCKIPFRQTRPYTVEVKCRPTVPDNIRYWQVFGNDDQIEDFLQCKNSFECTNIDLENENENVNSSKVEMNSVNIVNTVDSADTVDSGELGDGEVEADVLQLKSNVLPRGLVPLEDLFDSDDVAKKPKLEAHGQEVEDCNIGTDEKPRMVKLSKSLPPEQKLKYRELFEEYSDVFAWSYEDLKAYDTSIIQHRIPIKEDHKPFRQKLRRINPKLIPLIEKEIKKMYDAKIIVPLRFSKWVSNLVPTRKKTGEIRLCIDFRNLNKASLKDNYPLPKMDHLLQSVVGSSRISLLDGFSGYNQVLVHPDDQEKTAFTTPWGTFMYVKMPFGLMNAGATFQRAMDIAFIEETGKFIVVYLDDVTVFSQSDEEHLRHLRRVFEKCRRFGISLNPKKCLFGLEEGKLLGHIISKEGIRIDPSRIEAILKIEHPRNLKELQSFIGQINFLRRFIPNLAELLRNITNMLKKDAKIKWDPESRSSFEQVKRALTQAPVLISPNFTKDFYLFSFASEHTIAAVLLQKNSEGYEQPIAFFSKALRDAALNYNIMEKQAFALVKAIKDFRVYILHSHVIAYVPNTVVKDILTQDNPDGRRGKWIAVILEYDIEIKPTKLIKGQGLAKLMAESNLHALDINFLDVAGEQGEMATPNVKEVFLNSPWYADLIFVLQNLQAPPGLTKTKARFLKLKALKFCILEGNLYWKDPAGILLNCLLQDEADKVLQEFHAGECGGHMSWKATANKILRAGFYWPTLFADVHQKVTACHQCQLFEGKRKLLPLPLKPISVEAPFQQWGLDFIGEIHPPSSGQHKWILTATDYFTKWIEAVPSRQATDAVIIKFLENNILSRFGCPMKIITDNAAAFRSKKLIDFCSRYHIVLGHSTAYYPQGNGLAESSNKTLVNIIKKTLQENKKSWHDKLVFALWADRLTTKRSIGMSPYQLVYGTEAVFPTSLGVPVMKILQEMQAEPNDSQRRINQMIHLQQTREEVFNKTQVIQENIKKIFDKQTKEDDFELGDLVLKWDARNEDKGKHGKFDHQWTGPYMIQAFRGHNAFLLNNIDGSHLPGAPVNGRMLKHYIPPQ